MKKMERVSCLKWIGVVLLVTGIVIVFTWKNILTHFFNKELALSPTSQVYPIWEKSQIPIVLDIYLFNCTNSEELSRDFKPNFQEVGPYRFREFQNKVNITWNDNNTVTYRQQRFFYFDEDESVGTIQEKITMLNIPPIVASYKTRHWGNMASFGVFLSIKLLEKSIWVTKSIKEFLFEGYSDPLLTLSSIFSGEEKQKVGFFYGRNGSFTSDGYFNMETGAQDLSRIGILRQWNFANRTFSYDEGCDDVLGYLGHFFSPKMTKEPFYFFSGDICKSVKLIYAEEVDIFGIKGYKFLPEETLMDNGHTDPNTACNCGGDVCMPPGVLNLMGCVGEVPMFASNPHFLHADPAYLENLTGLAPDANRSKFHIIIEPNLGIPMDLAAHLQYNVLLEQNPKISLFEDVPNLIFPLFWLQKRILISEEMAQKIKFILLLPTLGTNCAVGLILLGLFMISISMVSRFFRRIHLSPIIKLKKRKTANKVITNLNGATFNMTEGDNEKELMKDDMNMLSKEVKMETTLNSKETDVLT